MKVYSTPGYAHVAVAAFAIIVSTAAAAQYPARPIRMLVPNPPGGATDNLARVIAPKLNELLGQTIVVDNRPGSNGNLSTEATAGPRRTATRCCSARTARSSSARTSTGICRSTR